MFFIKNGSAGISRSIFLCFWQSLVQYFHDMHRAFHLIQASDKSCHAIAFTSETWHKNPIKKGPVKHRAFEDF